MDPLLNEPSVVLTLPQTSGDPARITLNRPDRLNAMDRGVRESLRSCIKQVVDDPAVHVVIVAGAGSAFSAGADLRAGDVHEFTDMESYLSAQPSSMEYMLDPSTIFISAVNGYAIGGGFLLALFSDITIASESAKFSLPQAKLGIFPPYGAICRLAKMIGLGRAMEISLTGRQIGGEEALRIGLIQELCPNQSSLEVRAVEIAKTLLDVPALSRRMIKETALTSASLTQEHAMLLDRYRFYSVLKRK